MAQKVKDLAVKTSEYVDPATGETKGRFQNVGAVLRGDDGNEFLMLDRTFNPAGVPNPKGNDSVLIGMFDPRPKDGQQRRPQSGGSDYARASRGGQQTPPPPSDDDLPPDFR